MTENQDTSPQAFQREKSAAQILALLDSINGLDMSHAWDNPAPFKFAHHRPQFEATLQKISVITADPTLLAGHSNTKLTMLEGLLHDLYARCLRMLRFDATDSEASAEYSDIRKPFVDLCSKIKIWGDIIASIGRINKNLEEAWENINTSIHLDNKLYGDHPGPPPDQRPDAATHASVAETIRGATQQSAINALTSVFHVPSVEGSTLELVEIVGSKKAAWKNADCSLARLGWLIAQHLPLEQVNAVTLHLNKVWDVRGKYDPDAFQKLLKQRKKVSSHSDPGQSVAQKEADPDLATAVSFDFYQMIVTRGYVALAELMSLVGIDPKKGRTGQWVLDRKPRYQDIVGQLGDYFLDKIADSA